VGSYERLRNLHERGDAVQRNRNHRHRE
jgi:hypothetical protein